MSGFAGRLGFPVDLGIQAAAADKFQREIWQSLMLVDIVDLDDVGMLQISDGLSLGEEAIQLMLTGVSAGQDHFQSYPAVQADLPRLVHHSHAAPPKLADDLIARHQDLAGALPG